MFGPRSLLGGDGNAWSQVSSEGIPRKYTPRKVHCLVLTSSGGHQSGQYASYWNAFLLVNCRVS